MYQAACHDTVFRFSNLAPTEANVRMGRVLLVNLVSVGQGLAYQKRFEAIKSWGLLDSVNNSDKILSSTLKVVQTMMKDVTCGLIRRMPHGQTLGSIHGIRPLQCPLQHVHLCPGRSGWAETML